MPCSHREPGSRTKENIDTVYISSFSHFIPSRAPDHRMEAPPSSVGPLSSVNPMEMTP